MSIGFEVIEDSIVIVRTKSAYKQCKMYKRKRELYANAAGGFVRLNLGGGTSNPNVTWLEAEIEGKKAFHPVPCAGGNLEMKHATK